MRLWTVLAGLLVAGVMASSVYGAEGDKKDGKRGRGGFVTWEAMGLGADGVATPDLFVKTGVKNVPDDRKEAATTRLKERWKSMFGEAKEVKKPQWDEAVKKRMEEFKKKGGKKRGGGNT